MPRYHRIFIDGTLAAGNEQWSTSMACTSPSGAAPTAAALNAWAEAIRAAFGPGTGTFGTMRSLLSAAGTIQRVRIYSYPSVGAPADVAGASNGGPIAGNTDVDMPPQCSLVLSLLTGFAGRSNRGRMYWPVCTGTLNNAQRLQVVSQTFVNSVASFLNSLTSLSTGDPGEPAVVSLKNGTVTPVTAVSVGDVIDTQRRRRDKLVEGRFSATV